MELLSDLYPLYTVLAHDVSGEAAYDGEGLVAILGVALILMSCYWVYTHPVKRDSPDQTDAKSAEQDQNPDDLRLD